jgi:hypothetical protein
VSDLPRRVVRARRVQDLAGAHEIVERAQGVAEIGDVVEPVQVVDIDTVRL